MHLATIAAVTLAVLSSACTIVVAGPPADDSDESTSTTEAGSTTDTERAESSSTSEPEGVDSSTSREIASTGEIEDEEISTGEVEDESTTEADSGSTGSTGIGDDTTGESTDSSSTSGDEPSDLEPTLVLGELCVSDGECFSDLCREGVCTVSCEQLGPPCAQQGALGLCVRPAEESYCAGLHSFGEDLPDYVIVALGGQSGLLIADSLDTDLATLDLTSGGLRSVTVTAAADLDVRLDLYAADGEPLGMIDQVGAGEPEHFELDASAGMIVFAIVSGIAGTTGSAVVAVE